MTYHLTALAQSARAVEPVRFHPPLGPYTALTEGEFLEATSYASSDRLVFTPYFYWYDVYSGAHLFNVDGSDALTDHPPSTTGFSYRSVAWHRQQLLDAAEAGLDVLLPVYWGDPSQRLPGKNVADHPWSYAGIPPLVTARDTLLAEGRDIPRIGLFYDTSTLTFHSAGAPIDLTTEHGRQWFYESVRDFYSLVPPRHWAMIDGHPVIFLYAASFAARYDQSCIDALKSNFARDFGGRTPYVVRDVSWNVRTDQVYAWGGALGLRNPGVASLGPGYDHSAVPGREPLVVPRENGAFFERQWLRFLRRPSNFVFIETWNEFHEGTEIAASREYGRDYLNLNRRFVDLFKAGYQPPREIGPFTDQTRVGVTLGTNDLESGLIHLEGGDGLTRAAFVEGRECRVLAASPHDRRYLYLRVDDSFKWAPTMDVVVQVECFDAVRGTVRVEFDGSDPSAPFQGAYTASDFRALHGARQWRTLSFHLRGARFLNGQNHGADLRIDAANLELPIRSVHLLREGLFGSRFGIDGSFELRLTGIPEATYRIEASADLIEWAEQVRLRPSQPISWHRDLLPQPRPPVRWYRWIRE